MRGNVIVQSQNVELCLFLHPTNMCLRNYSVYKSNIRCSSQAKRFAFVNLVQMSLHLMSLLRGKKDDDDVMSTALKRGPCTSLLLHVCGLSSSI